jgi:mRNA interferase RelE/StbE
MYELRFLVSALDDLRRLDKSMSRRILLRLEWLVTHFEEIRPEPLSGEFAELNKFRVGDYRLIYQIVSAESAIMIHAVGHRREIYRRR